MLVDFPIAVFGLYEFFFVFQEKKKIDAPTSMKQERERKKKDMEINSKNEGKNSSDYSSLN
jgi:hypothetical protein